MLGQSMKTERRAKNGLGGGKYGKERLKPSVQLLTFVFEGERAMDRSYTDMKPSVTVVDLL
jgi:hypothetical protein